jgi:hypothetical protein
MTVLFKRIKQSKKRRFDRIPVKELTILAFSGQTFPQLVVLMHTLGFL